MLVAVPAAAQVKAEGGYALVKESDDFANGFYAGVDVRLGAPRTLGLSAIGQFARYAFCDDEVCQARSIGGGIRGAVRPGASARIKPFFQFLIGRWSCCLQQPAIFVEPGGGVIIELGRLVNAIGGVGFTHVLSNDDFASFNETKFFVGVQVGKR